MACIDLTVEDSVKSPLFTRIVPPEGYLTPPPLVLPPVVPGAPTKKRAAPRTDGQRRVSVRRTLFPADYVAQMASLQKRMVDFFQRCCCNCLSNHFRDFPLALLCTETRPTVMFTCRCCKSVILPRTLREVQEQAQCAFDSLDINPEPDFEFQENESEVHADDYLQY
jgi:hypothetical protein